MFTRARHVGVTLGRLTESLNPFVRVNQSNFCPCGLRHVIPRALWCNKTSPSRLGPKVRFDMDSKKWLVVLLVGLLFCQEAVSLRLVEVRIPVHAVRGQDPRLECHFDLQGEALYSVKWYKDGNEFYRFVPRDMPPAQLFPLPGVAVDIHNSTESQVVLKSVNLSSTGKYRCEVSAEAPSFQTVSDHGDMTVVALPDEGPRISGGRPRYQVGDMVRVNCTSGRSKPAAQLVWFINGQQADSSFLRGPDIVQNGREDLETSVLGLEFRVMPKHFKRGDMKLKCLATIATVYWRSNEESVEGDRPQRTPVLESRETVPPSQSRADRVQANTACLTLLPSCHLLVACGIIAFLTTQRGSVASIAATPR